MSLLIECACGQKLKVRDEFAGKKVKCPKCGKVVTAPVPPPLEEEPNEPPHVHVDRDALSAKFWLDPIGLARNFGFTPKELGRIQKIIEQHQAEFLEAWHGHLGG